jgi:hypothetical protein
MVILPGARMGLLPMHAASAHAIESQYIFYCYGDGSPLILNG